MNGCLILLFVLIVFAFLSGGPLVFFFLPALFPLIIIVMIWMALRGVFAQQAQERQRTAMGFPPTPREEKPRVARAMPSGLQLILGLVAAAAGIGLVVWGMTRL